MLNTRPLKPSVPVRCLRYMSPACIELITAAVPRSDRAVRFAEPEGVPEKAVGQAVDEPLRRSTRVSGQASSGGGSRATGR